MVSLLVHFKRHKTNPDKQTQKIFSCQTSSTKIIEGIQYHHSELGPAVVKNRNNMILLRRNRAAEVVGACCDVGVICCSCVSCFSYVLSVIGGVEI